MRGCPVAEARPVDSEEIRSALRLSVDLEPIQCQMRIPDRGPADHSRPQHRHPATRPGLSDPESNICGSGFIHDWQQYPTWVSHSMRGRCLYAESN
jgi:hypothetical protein